MIEKRQRKGVKGYAEEYYLFVRSVTGGILYNDWYSPDELAELDEAQVEAQALRCRINGTNKKKYNNLWDALTDKKRHATKKRYSKPIDAEYILEVSKRIFRLTGGNVDNLKYWQVNK